jgi:putative nucleotidyltransferase with HDIG domain
MNHHILIVDSETNQLNALQRSFRRTRNGWTVSMAENAMDALALLSSQPVDILITETRLPGMNGLELLSKTRKVFPHVIRIVLSGHAEQEVVLKSLGVAHQYLSKPCDDPTLMATISRAFLIRDLIADETLQALATSVKSLPSLPRLYLELTRELQSAEPSIAKVTEIVSRDLGLTSKLLQLVNSSFFGLPQPISDVGKAINLLGMDMLKAIALASGVASQFKTVRIPGSSMEALWIHSFNTGALARELCQAEALEPAAANDAYMAGLLHDIGKLILAGYLPDEFKQAHYVADARRLPLWAAEKAILGVSHAELGGYLLGLWGLPESVIKAVAYHHRPQAGPSAGLAPLLFVYLANVFEKAGAGILESDKPIEGLDRDYLVTMGREAQVPRWRKLCADYLTQSASAEDR